MDAVKENPNSSLHVDSYGTKLYYLPDGKTLHREDGPAVEQSNGNKAWWFNGKHHRTNGPAIEYGDGRKEYYLNGVQYSFEEWQVARKMLWML